MIQKKKIDEIISDNKNQNIIIKIKSKDLRRGYGWYLGRR